MQPENAPKAFGGRALPGPGARDSGGRGTGEEGERREGRREGREEEEGEHGGEENGKGGGISPPRSFLKVGAYAVDLVDCWTVRTNRH